MSFSELSFNAWLSFWLALVIKSTFLDQGDREIVMVLVMMIIIWVATQLSTVMIITIVIVSGMVMMMINWAM